MTDEQPGRRRVGGLLWSLLGVAVTGLASAVVAATQEPVAEWINDRIYGDLSLSITAPEDAESGAAPARVPRCVIVEGRAEGLRDGQRVWLAEHGQGDPGRFSFKQASVDGDDTWSTDMTVGKEDLPGGARSKSFVIDVYVLDAAQTELLESMRDTAMSTDPEVLASDSVTVRRVGDDPAACST